MVKGNTCKLKENHADKIIDKLYLGNESISYDRQFLINNNIKHIIRVMPKWTNMENIYDDITYVVIPIVDSQVCKINLNNMFNFTNNFIKCILHNDKCGSILVHCKRGHHRSGAIIAAYLIKHLNMSFADSLKYINYIRPCAMRRNTCMTKGLYIYYNYLHNKKCSNVSCTQYGNVQKCKCLTGL